MLARLREAPLDVLILGGGINGAGIARDLALRNGNLRIGLVEKNHFGSGTSGRNSHLIHGGLRYLKYFDFGLVREALRERAILLKIAPDFVRPLRFILPFEARGWYYNLGLTVYDVLAGKYNIETHRMLSLADVAKAEPGINTERFAGAATFWDCAVDSARLVLENVLDAVRHGAMAANYAAASRSGGEFVIDDRIGGEQFTITARTVVDATGAWSRTGSLRLVRGSHLVLPRLNEGDSAISYFEEKGRIIFFIPWGSKMQCTLVGTTDVDHAGSPDEVEISADERDYLLDMAARVFRPAAVRDPIGSFSSLRPLVRDDRSSATSTSREHRIWTDDSGTVHVAGGKYTTYRLMSEIAADQVCKRVAPNLVGKSRTAHVKIESDRPRGLPEEELTRWAYEHEFAQRPSDVLTVSTTWGFEGAHVL
jgi:glycerol-3-phosphate dehydrogenase